MDPVSLAATRGGQRWLRNFDGTDAETATTLLESIVVISDRQFRSDMRSLLERVATADPPARTAAIPVSSLPEDFGPHYYGCTEAHKDGPLEAHCPALKPAGSELIVEHILRKARRDLRLLISPSVTAIGNHNVTKILLVTDTIVSGSEARRFGRFIYSNPTLKSLHSYRKIKIEYVTHSVTSQGLENLDRRFPVNFEQWSRTFESAGWNRTKISDVEELCKRFAYRSGDATGWEGARSLQIYAHTFGNGTPAVLRQQKGPGAGSWQPLLRWGRSYGLDALDAAAADGYSARLPFDLRARAAINWASRRVALTIAATPLIERDVNAIRGEAPLRALLSAVHLGVRDKLQIMRLMDLSSTRYSFAVELGARYGLIESAPANGGNGAEVDAEVVALTRAGNRLLARYQRKAVSQLKARERRDRARRDPAKTSATAGSTLPASGGAPPTGDPFYYPHTLR